MRIRLDSDVHITVSQVLTHFNPSRPLIVSAFFKMFQLRENIRKESLKCQHYGVNDTAESGSAVSMTPRRFYAHAKIQLMNKGPVGLPRGGSQISLHCSFKT